jgi:hypothetical protein
MYLTLNVGCFTETMLIYYSHDLKKDINKVSFFKYFWMENKKLVDKKFFVCFNVKHIQYSDL